MRKKPLASAAGFPSGSVRFPNGAVGAIRGCGIGPTAWPRSHPLCPGRVGAGSGTGGSSREQVGDLNLEGFDLLGDVKIEIDHLGSSPLAVFAVHVGFRA